MNHAATTKDYVAHTMIGAGGSWARDANPDKAIERCAKIAKADWGKLYKLDGETITVALADVTGHDQVIFGSGGVKAGGKFIPYQEYRDVILPGKKRP